LPSFDLVRVAVHEDGAFGVLLEDGLPFALTLERTYDESGRIQRVKIPRGTWLCRSSYYHGGGYDTYEVHVPGYRRLLFHKGNVEGDSEGCILLGRRAGKLNGQPAVLESRLAFDEFMRRTTGRPELHLRVREVPR
jgi:hypothetical protein